MGAMLPNDCKMGTVSRIVMLRICRIVKTSLQGKTFADDGHQHMIETGSKIESHCGARWYRRKDDRKLPT